MALNEEGVAKKRRVSLARYERLLCKNAKLSTKLTLDAAKKLDFSHMLTHDLTAESCNELPKTTANCGHRSNFHRDPYISILPADKSARYQQLNHFSDLYYAKGQDSKSKPPQYASFGILETSYRREKYGHRSRHRNRTRIEGTNVLPVFGSRHYSNSGDHNFPYDIFYKRHPYVCLWKRGQATAGQGELRGNSTSPITVRKLLLPQLTKQSTKRLPQLPQPEVGNADYIREMALRGSRKRGILLSICRAKMHLLSMPHPRSKSVEKKNAETQCQDGLKAHFEATHESANLIQPLHRFVMGPRVAKLLDRHGDYRYNPPSRLVPPVLDDPAQTIARGPPPPPPKAPRRKKRMYLF